MNNEPRSDNIEDHVERLTRHMTGSDLRLSIDAAIEGMYHYSGVDESSGFNSAENLREMLEHVAKERDKMLETASVATPQDNDYPSVAQLDVKKAVGLHHLTKFLEARLRNATQRSVA